MAYTVKIKYVAPVEPTSADVASISSVFNPGSVYTDTAAYDGTVYDTNVKGFGSIELAEPFATTSYPSSSPLAQFKVAQVGTDNEITFTVDSYAEAFYYKETGIQLADEGFTVTVTEASAS